MNTSIELAETELFKGLTPDALSIFASIAHEERFEPTQIVYSGGSPGDSLYVIVQGAFVVRITDEGGDDVEVATLKAGSYFGEMEVIGGMSRTASVMSAGAGRCYRFDAGELLATLNGNAVLAAHFYGQVSRELIRRLKNTTRDMGYFKVRAI